MIYKMMFYIFGAYICCTLYFFLSEKENRRLFKLLMNYIKPEQKCIEPIKEIKPEPIKERYEDKYLDKYRMLEVVELTDEKIESLNCNFIMEKCPIGNVIMKYDFKKESFVYFSDHVIPYRFLEPIGRKYVLTFDCKQLFVDMKYELEKTGKNVEVDKPVIEKSKVFAKFKNYKKEAKQVINSHLIKEKTNRYTCEGKFSNFNLLKKVDRKAVDKNYNVSFAQFKAMQK